MIQDIGLIGGGMTMGENARYKVDCHLTLGCFDSAVGLTWRYRVSLAKELSRLCVNNRYQKKR